MDSVFGDTAVKNVVQNMKRDKKLHKGNSINYALK